MRADFNPYRGILERRTPEEYERMARTASQRQADAAPLLADQLPPLTPDAIRQSEEEHADAWDRMTRKFKRFARLCRYFVSKRVDPITLSCMDSRRLCSPPAPEYTADFWRRRLGDLCGRDDRYQKPKRTHA